MKERSLTDTDSSNLPGEPLVSVVMAVYNAGDYLGPAIESIRRQTYRHWELVCWDDASSDCSFEILRSLASKDDRIKVYCDGKHRGVASTANLALAMVRGEFIARMDADDIAFPWRLQKQVEYLRTHQDVVAVGGQCILIDSDGRAIGRKTFPTDPELVRRMIFLATPVQQPTLMVCRLRLPNDFLWYREGGLVAIDVELFFRLFQYGQVSNIPEFVLQYRVHGANISLTDPKRTFFLALKERIRGVFAYGYRPTFIGIFVTLFQVCLISLLPSHWIYPVYAFLRGMSKSNMDSIAAGTTILVGFPVELGQNGDSKECMSTPTPNPLHRG